mgnify:CR=1 FL=1
MRAVNTTGAGSHPSPYTPISPHGELKPTAALVIVKCASTGLSGHAVDRQDVLRAGRECDHEIHLGAQPTRSRRALAAAARAKPSVPSAVQGMFMNRLSGLGTSGGIRPSSRHAGERGCPVQLSWWPSTPRKA